MMIASILEVCVRATASPPEGLRPILVKFYLIAAIFLLEFALEVSSLRFLLDAIAPPSPVLWALPGDELQITFVFVTVLALAVLIVPLGARTAHVPTRFFMRRPVCGLTCLAFKKGKRNADQFMTSR
jgi:hypothetical protein